MEMTTRLGLDIGTKSIGWCLYQLNEKQQPISIIDIGVRIFSDGREPKSGASLAVSRREARAMRRRRDRYLRRRTVLLDALINLKLLPANKADAKALTLLDPYALRRDALDEVLQPYPIGRALFHLNQRRGFLSNRKTERASGDDKENGKIAAASKALDIAMAALGARTYGEFLFLRSQSTAPAGARGRDNALPAKRIRLRADGEGYDFYPERRHLEGEFDAIWVAQAPHHPTLMTDAARERLHRIIFFQRPLKAPKVGGCTYFPEEKRLAKAHPLFQERRLYEEVNQLEILSAGKVSRKLTLDQRDAIILKLKSSKTASFSALAKLLKLADGERFNKESDSRKGLNGDEIAASFKAKSCFGPRWEHFDAATQWSIIELVAEEEDPVRLHQWLSEHHGVDADQAHAIGRIRLPDGYGRLGETASRLILDALKQGVHTYNAAVEIALDRSHSDFRTGEIWEKLPYYGEILSREIPPGTLNPADAEEIRWGKITNPTVHIGLNQLRKVVNAIIARYGRPTEMVVELARDLKLNDKQKEEHRKAITANTRAAEARSQKLVESGQIDSGANRLRLKMWEELNPQNTLDRSCPYCGEHIGQAALFSEVTEIEHIIPYSLCLDDSPANKILAHRHCNRAKGNKTPWQKWGESDRWPLIAAQVAKMPKSRQWRFGPDAMERYEKDGGFLARQLTDTQYLSRISRSYLSSLYPQRPDDRLPGEGVSGVYVIPGRMTAMLRRLWGLNELLPDHNVVENVHSNAPKNRLDHRHHAIDAAIVGVTSRGLLNQISRAAARAEEQHLDRLFSDLPRPWDRYREDLYEALQQIIISHKSDHGRKGRPEKNRDMTAGALHNDTAYGLTGEFNAAGLPIVVRRLALLSLKPADISAPDRIPDPKLQMALAKACSGKSGKDFEKALLDFSQKDEIFKGIRRVRVREALNVIPIHDRSGHAFKAYKGDGNARYDVWKLPNGKWVTSWKDRDGQRRSSILSMFDAHQAHRAEHRPHPAAKKVLSLRQNDLLAIEEDGKARRIMRVVKFSASGIALADHVEAGPLKARDALPHDVDPFKYFNSSASGLQKAKARQIRIDALGHIFDPGPR
jgi:CRISPR-associated endonuclease Csn1